MSVQAHGNITQSAKTNKTRKTDVKVTYDIEKGVYVFSSARNSENLSAKDIAQNLLDDITGLGTDEKFYTHLKMINEENVIDVLKNYKQLSESAFGNGMGETLIDSIYKEFGLDTHKQQIYANIVKDALVKTSDDLGIDNSVMNRKWDDETDKITKGFLPKIGIVDTQNLNFFTDEYIKRINIRKRLVADNEIKFKNSDDITPRTNVLAYVNKVIEKFHVDTNDTLGDGKINHKVKQVNGTCWAVAGINAFAADEETREHLNSLILKKDGITSVYLPEADKVYSFTENEILDATYRAIGAVGDGDVNAFLMAVDKHFKEKNEPNGANVRHCNKLERMFKLLTGKEADTTNISLKLADTQKGALIYREYVSEYALNEYLANYNKDNKSCAVISFGGWGCESEEPVKIKAGDSAANAVKSKVRGGHAYSIEKIDGKYIFMKDSNTPDSLVCVPHSFLWYADGMSVYKYR